MLNAYISKDEIQKLLESSECINGMINKREFQQAILGIKEHKKPKKEKVSRVNNVNIIIDNIKKYRNLIKCGVIESSVRKELIKNGIGRDSQLVGMCIDDRHGWGLLAEDDIVFTLRDLAKALGISTPTANEWKKKNIIIEHYVQEIKYRLETDWVIKEGSILPSIIYSLNEIENNLKHCISKD